MIKTCLNCGKEYKAKSESSKFCSHSCHSTHQNTQKQLEWEEKWMNGEVNGNKDTVWTQTSRRVRTYLMKKYNGKCSVCGWGETNPYTGTIPLEIEHIDGDPYNTTPNNVTLLCPNCHSLTATYRGANKGNGRKKTWTPVVK